MIEKTYFYYNRDSDNPHETLALEEAILTSIKDNEMVFYLYVHKPSVIIGKNQNAWKECRISELERYGGTLARRISGGGAVYHDRGNLNFSFITNSTDYDTARQLSVISNALSQYGINAEVSGRNDILANGRKFSGNAFCFKKNRAFHHGTILVNVNKNNLSKFLSVSADKIETKGIKSVRSRICNLADLCRQINIDSLTEKLKTEFFNEYGNGADYIPDVSVLNNALNIAERNRSWDWVFGYQGNFDINMHKRFSWGDIELNFNLRDAVIQNATVYSDAMDADYISSLGSVFTGNHFSGNELAAAIKATAETSEQAVIANDIIHFLYEKTSS